MLVMHGLYSVENGVGLWADVVRVPPSGTWERRRADLYGLAEQWLGPMALTIAITNDPDSPLARAAEFLVDLGAGAERAVAATKTYTFPRKRPAGGRPMKPTIHTSHEPWVLASSSPRFVSD